MTITSLVGDAFESIFGKHGLRGAVELGDPVGCSSGKPSNWLLLDYNFSNPIFHAYPRVAGRSSIRGLLSSP